MEQRLLFKATASYDKATERTGCFLTPPLTSVDRAAVNAPPKVSRVTAQAPVAKGYGVSCQPVLPGPCGNFGGGMSHGPVSVTRWRCGVDSGRLLQPSPLRCAAVHHSVG